MFEFFNLLINIFGRESQFLVEHRIWRRVTEGIQTVNLAVASYQVFQVDGESGGESELLHTGIEHRVAIVGRLCVEETL